MSKKRNAHHNSGRIHRNYLVTDVWFFTNIQKQCNGRRIASLQQKVLKQLDIQRPKKKKNWAST